MSEPGSGSSTPVVATGFTYVESWDVGDETRDASHSSDDGLAEVVARRSSGGGSFAGDHSSGTNQSSSSSTTTYEGAGSDLVFGFFEDAEPEKPKTKSDPMALRASSTLSQMWSNFPSRALV